MDLMAKPYEVTKFWHFDLTVSAFKRQEWSSLKICHLRGSNLKPPYNFEVHVCTSYVRYDTHKHIYVSMFKVN